ncbi:hypothetical protein [Streptomyces sp. NPDC049555]|uniref:hypothetical protein n=1 Tax=unclassified Streptomyces TaxID=2593676 RepID=UPI003434D89F
MAEAEYSARGVRIERDHRSLTRAGQVQIKDGRLELLTSYGREIDSAPVDSVQARKPWLARDRARATVNGHHYVLTLAAEHEAASEDKAEEEVNRFLEVVRSAHGSTPKH